ncbi:hypothetical protein BGZ68_007137, partial [Mortierella alpina]
MTKKLTSSVPEHDEQGDNKSVSSQHMRKRDKFFNMFRSDKSEVHANPSAGRPNAKVHGIDPGNMKIGDDHSSAHSSIVASSSETTTPPTTEKTKVRADIFSTNVAKPAVKI